MLPATFGQEPSTIEPYRYEGLGTRDSNSTQPGTRDPRPGTTEGSTRDFLVDCAIAARCHPLTPAASSLLTALLHGATMCARLRGRWVWKRRNACRDRDSRHAARGHRIHQHGSDDRT